MRKIRVLVANRPRLMRDLVLATISEQPDIEVLGELENDSQLASAVAELNPDFVIIALDQADERPAICDYLLVHYPSVKVLAVAPEQDSSVFFWSDIRSAPVVKIVIEERLRVLQVPGVVSLVGFNGKFPALPEPEITALRNGLENNLYAEPHPYLRIGRRVRVVRGPMAGAEGILTRKKDKYRVVISIDVLMRSVAVEVDGPDLELVVSNRLVLNDRLRN